MLREKRLLTLCKDEVKREGFLLGWKTYNNLNSNRSIIFTETGTQSDESDLIV